MSSPELVNTPCKDFPPDESHSVIEVPKKEFTLNRLDKTYKFITSFLPGLSYELARPIEILDIGTHNGELAHHFTQLREEVIGSIQAIDINKEKIKKVLSQPALKKDLESNRYSVYQMDGTNMIKDWDESFDFVNCTEVLVALKGKFPALVREVNRVLRSNGLAVFTFPNKDVWETAGFGNFDFKKFAFSRSDFDHTVREEFKGDIRIGYFGQLPITVDRGGTYLPIAVDNNSENYKFYPEALSICPAFSEDGNQQMNPFFWVACVRKFQ
jgi:SAM-dependent methyltransferase